MRASYALSMSGETGIFCLLAGLGLLAAMHGQYTFTRIGGVLLAVAANLHFAAAFTGFSVSLPGLFPMLGDEARQVSGALPAESALATAVPFFLFGCALALMGPRRSNQILAVKAAIGVVLTVIGGVVLFGDVHAALFQMPSDARMLMPFGTAVAVLVIGISLCILCALHSRVISEELSPSSIAIAAIGLVLIFGASDTAIVVKARTGRLADSGLDAPYAKLRAVQKCVHFFRTAESSERGYLLTGDDKSLGAYMSSLNALRAELEAPGLSQASEWIEHDLANLFTERVSQFEAIMALERSGRHQDAVAQASSPASTALSEKIELESAFMMSTLDAGAERGQAERQLLTHNLENLVLTSYGVAALLIALTVLLARYEARQHRKTSMKALNQPACSVPQSARAAAFHSEKTCVLLIDDSEDIKCLIEYAFEKHALGRYQLIWARCLKDGFQELLDGGVHVVLLDLGLPESAGLISYACVRGCAPQVPVLVMTGDACHETADLIIAAGVDDYLVKQQLSGTRLVQAIDAVLSNDERRPQRNLSGLLTT